MPNGSFETYTTLPNGYGQWFKCIGWSNLNGYLGFAWPYASPDYLHTLGTGGSGLPNSTFGTVIPYSGNAIMGFVGIHGGSSNFREYVSVQLSSPMVVGAQYDISFYITNGSSNHYAGHSCNHIGLRLSTLPLIQNTHEPLGVAPHYEIPGQLWSLTWMPVTYTFTADSAYTHLTIGNFYNDLNTTSVSQVSGSNAAYYFIDDVEVIKKGINILGNSICSGDSVTLKAIGDTSIIWADSLNPGIVLGNDTILKVAPTMNTTYYAYGTSDTASYTVIVDNPPVVNLGPDTTLCQGEQLILNASTTNATYLWHNNTTNATFNVSQAGNYWVRVKVGSCFAYDTIAVTYVPTPMVNLGNDTTLCQGEILQLKATNSGAGYLWQDSSTDSTLTVSQAGAYWVKVDLNNCSATDTINVSYVPWPVVNLGPDTTLCQGEILLLDASTTNATYEWQNSSTNPVFTVNSPATYWVKVTVNNCSSFDSINVSYTPLPVVDIGNDTTLCQGDLITLNATTAGATYLWQDNSTNAQYSASQAGTYKVTVTVNNCSSSDSITISLNPLPIINLGNDTTLCEGELVILDANTTNATYLWQDNTTNPTISASQSGIYWVEITVDNCSAVDTLLLNYFPPPVIDLGRDTTVCYGESVLLDTPIPGATYLWSDNSTNSSLNVTTEGTYWVEVNNCGKGSDTIEVKYEECNCDIIFPNAFSPNGDHINDKFIPIHTCSYLEYSFMIFNRWGEKIYESDNPSDIWDGTYHGIDAPLGVYVYVVQFQFSNRKRMVKHGNITLLR